MLIAFEGIDGAGKTTQAQRLKRYLEAKGEIVVILKEPTGGTWGRLIAELAEHGRNDVNQEFEYFLNDRKEDVANNIRPALDRGQIVVMDRYYYSSIAYQSTKGLDPMYIEEMNLAFAPRPDIVILLDISPETARHRIETLRGGAANHFEKGLAPVRAVFLALSKTHREIVVINGEAGADKVEEEVIQAVLPLLPHAAGG